MGLSAGMRLGPYEVAGLIGQGGMGEVYRARDSRLDRDVALKILPDLFADQPDRLLRFQREAKALAALNHRNIAQIHGVEESEGIRALVLEYVEGRTLAERIATGPLPVQEALPIAEQIAEALEAAHEAGIVHRDLKPANVKVTDSGVVKVLDFGLAKALERGPAAEGSESPTITAASTRDGVIMGTAAYMSPEQARGRPVDRRADIWAFGAVLFEMLTSRRAFERETVADTVAAIIETEPAYGRLPPDVPSPIQRLIRRCLVRNPQDRLRDIGDARIEIAETRRAPASLASDATSGVPVARPLDRVWPRILPWVAGLLLGASLAGLWSARSRPPVARLARPVEFPVVLSPNERISGPGGSVIAVSPDGARVAYLANRQIWVRELDSLAARPIPGTQIGGSAFTRDIFFSHDGRWIGFTAGRELRKVSLEGVQRTVTPMQDRPAGAYWSDDDWIYFGRRDEGVWRVSGEGGAPEQLIALREGERARRPQPLPGGEWMLYTLLPPPARTWDEAQIVVQSLSTGAREVLMDGREAVFVPSGHLVYVLKDALQAVAFDPTSRKVAAAPVRLAGSLYSAGLAQFSVSDTGTIAYLPSASVPSTTRLLWVDRDGREDETAAPAREYGSARVSPKGDKLALSVRDADNGRWDVWLWDVAGKALSRLTVMGAGEMVWAGPSRLAVVTDRSGTIEARMISLDGAVEPDRLFAASLDTRLFAVTADDGLIIAQRRPGPEGQMDIHLVRSGMREPQALIATEFHEVRPALSPDGRWLAYQSDQSGRPEIFVVPYPGVGERRWQVSIDGGEEPKWSARGDELYYVDTSTGIMMAVAIDGRAGLSLRQPRPLFSVSDYALTTVNAQNYDVAPDGRFLFRRAAGPAGADAPQFVVMLDWQEKLRPGGPQLR
jgi:serine/threonine-protein kinase